MSFFRLVFFSLAFIGLSATVQANAVLNLGPMPVSLKQLKVPEVPGLLDGSDPIVTNKEQAIILGKALFWDMNVGSDGMACASCHFHAGADRRTQNQLAPGGQSYDLAVQRPEFNANVRLKSMDFPFFQTREPLKENSGTVLDKHWVTGSAGTFGGVYQKTGDSTLFEDCTHRSDSVFHSGKALTRRVTPRNAPSVINAIFNQRNFWDGRANNRFNGENAWGDRDPKAGVWVMDADQSVHKQHLSLENASLASLATAPPLNTTEMSCEGRSLAIIGKKLLSRKALEKQKVHWNDSVLGGLSSSRPDHLQSGLNVTYEQLIKKAFNSKYWAYEGKNVFGSSSESQPYRQIEANFSLFFGLSIQLYIGTLVSDESPFDLSRRDENYLPIDLTPSQLNGLEHFRSNMCVNCHLGPDFTSAAVLPNADLARSTPAVFADLKVSTNAVKRIPVLIDNMPLTVFADTGFASSGVSTIEEDIGLGGVDDFGNPLAFSTQYLQYLAGYDSAVKDALVRQVRPCDFEEPFALNFKPPYLASSLFTPEEGVQPQHQGTENCLLKAEQNAFIPTVEAAQAELKKKDNKKMLSKVQGSFKIPSLRNIELTGPYMHNGGMATLEQVIEFYARGGNFEHEAKELTLVFPLPRLQFSKRNRDDLIAFLKTLTDERVRYQKAPFDHPELIVPQGHVKAEISDTDSVNLAQDQTLELPAIGAEGSADPLKPFAYYLDSNN